VDILEIGHRIDPVFVHEARERGAVESPVVCAEPVGFVARHAERRHDIGRHPRLDLVEEPGGGRVERVVEVEDPGLDTGEVGGRGAFGHGPAYTAPPLPAIGCPQSAARHRPPAIGRP
jgi:hypothetical protein